MMTRFIVLRNESSDGAAEGSLSMEQLQHLTYYACLNYGRSKTRIDIPTAIRYADLCANRTLLLAKEELKNIVTASPSSRMLKNEESIIRTLNDKVQHEREDKSRLYFC